MAFRTPASACTSTAGSPTPAEARTAIARAGAARAAPPPPRAPGPAPAPPAGARRRAPAALAAQGCRRSPRARAVHPPARTRVGLSARLLAPFGKARALRDLRPLGPFQGRHVSAHGDRDGGVRPAADELSAPHPDLRADEAQLPRAARAHRGAGDDVPLRTLRCRRRPVPRARDDAQ